MRSTSGAGGAVPMNRLTLLAAIEGSGATAAPSASRAARVRRFMISLQSDYRMK
jgi:hypothetical protein